MLGPLPPNRASGGHSVILSSQLSGSIPTRRCCEYTSNAKTQPPASWSCRSTASAYSFRTRGLSRLIDLITYRVGQRRPPDSRRMHRGQSRRRQQTEANGFLVHGIGVQRRRHGSRRPFLISPSASRSRDDCLGFTWPWPRYHLDKCDTTWHDSQGASVLAHHLVPTGSPGGVSSSSVKSMGGLLSTGYDYETKLVWCFCRADACWPNTLSARRLSAIP